MALTEAGLRAGSGAKQAVMMFSTEGSISGQKVEGGGGALRLRAAWSVSIESASNGRFPVNSSYRMRPTAYRSLRMVTS